jgi:hypothetical protein
MIVKRTNDAAARLPVQDYSLAIRQAVSWLGGRYLLAEPVRAHARRGRGPQYFQPESSWITPHRARN